MADPEPTAPTRNFAEFHADSAPEVVVEEKILASELPPVKGATANGGTTFGKFEQEKNGYPYGAAELPTKGQPKRRWCGHAPRIAIILLIVLLLIIIGVILGVVLGMRHSSGNAPPTSSQTTSSTPSSPTVTYSPSSTVSPTSLSIIQAIYGNSDVTAGAKSSFPQNSYFFINTSSFPTVISNPDPWYGNKKCLSMLYQFGSSIRTFAACDNDGPYTLVPGNITLSPRTQEISRQGPSSASFAIVSVVWGGLELRGSSLYSTLYAYKNNGTAVPFTNALFGEDTLLNSQKSGVIWYTEDNFKTFKSIFSKETGTVSF